MALPPFVVGLLLGTIVPAYCLIILTEPAESKPGLLNFEYLYGTTGAELEANKIR